MGLLILLINIIVWTQNRNNKFLTFTSLASLIVVIIVGGIGGAVVLTERAFSKNFTFIFSSNDHICLGLSYVSVNTINFSFKNQLILDKYSLMAESLLFCISNTSFWVLCSMEGKEQFALHALHSVFNHSSIFLRMGAYVPQNCIIFNRLIGLYFLYKILKEIFYNCIYTYIFFINDIESDNFRSIKPMDKFDVWIRVAIWVRQVYYGVQLLFFLVNQLQNVQST